MMTGINEIGVARLCDTCAKDMEPTFVMLCMGALAKGKCERCGCRLMTEIYRYTMRGHEYDRRGIEMVF